MKLDWSGVMVTAIVCVVVIAVVFRVRTIRSTVTGITTAASLG